MEEVSLIEVMEFSLGKNVTRLKEQNEDIYTPEDFECDLTNRIITGETYGCIINLIKSKAAPITVNTEKKVITQNFLKCKLDETKILPWYFCYKFNESKDLEQQIAMYHQGTTLSVRKLNVKTIGDLKIKLPDLEKQKLIGEGYRKSILQHELYLKRANDIRKYTLEMLRKIEED
ncbi:restriction endonuclease subunit S [Lachnobacterium bovis]|uniref:Type I restriction modification DNA specificity domain-containing protein n=1 Tax=Lachnobacterium bovis TaxID=140626 RepID=A0A1H9U9K6_9FIRM|nr:restriction endonuclease subunit S [Lachnobacterium bovis]SES05941.1 Type I restriction modification DNA specificity domain-containing protein [Lachnobacterium bovis]